MQNSNNNFYKNNFYKNRHKESLYAAKSILTIVQEIIPRLESAVDFGCGVGTWLSALRKKGVKDILGIDGSWVNRKYLEIPSEFFIEYDLSKKISLPKKYDLAISMEVGEHLPSKSADVLVTSLTHSSDFILFSAAIPGQGGINHINEQYLDYWVKLFKERDYIGLDVIRRKIWNDELIPFFYRQNSILYVKKERILDLRQKHEVIENIPISIIHPKLYQLLYRTSLNYQPNIRESLKILLRAILAITKYYLKVIHKN